jgi:hypothetical protein
MNVENEKELILATKPFAKEVKVEKLVAPFHHRRAVGRASTSGIFIPNFTPYGVKIALQCAGGSDHRADVHHLP